jgi:hypothetical protein
MSVARRVSVAVVALAALGAAGEIAGGRAPPGDASPVEKTWSHPRAAVTARLSAGRVVLADDVTLVLRVESEPGLSVRWPALGDSIGTLAVVSREESPAAVTPAGDGLGGASRLAVERRLVLRPTAIGAAEVPAMEFRFAPDGTRAGAGAGGFSILTTPMRVEVVSVVDDATRADPGALRGAVAAPASSARGAWVALAGAGVLGAAMAGAWVARRRRPAPADPVAALRARLRRLEAEVASGLAGAAGGAAELSAILREYLALRTAIPAPDLTTEEIRSRLAAEPRTAERGAALAEVLSRCDLAKFAGQGAGAAALRADIRAVDEFMTLTEAAVTIEAERSRQRGRAA